MVEATINCMVIKTAKIALKVLDTNAHDMNIKSYNTEVVKRETL